MIENSLMEGWGRIISIGGNRVFPAAIILIIMFSNWAFYFETWWMDEVNHFLFGVLLFTLFGWHAIYLVPTIGIAWELYEVLLYPIPMFTPGIACYQDDTLLDLVLPIAAVSLLFNLKVKYAGSKT